VQQISDRCNCNASCRLALDRKTNGRALPQAMTTSKDQRLTKRDLMIAVWETLDCESVGARELREIREAAAERFGASAVESPAAIARILADEGAVLRHPEVLEYDAQWREARLQDQAGQEADWSNLAAAAESLLGFEELRKQLTEAGNRAKLRELSDKAAKITQDRLMLAESPVLSQSDRAEAAEIAAWLEVWVRAPDLFQDWLALRLAAPEFRRRFAGKAPKS
jgi:hypothetical protein